MMSVAKIKVACISIPTSSSLVTLSSFFLGSSLCSSLEDSTSLSAFLFLFSFLFIYIIYYLKGTMLDSH